MGVGNCVLVMMMCGVLLLMVMMMGSMRVVRSVRAPNGHWREKNKWIMQKAGLHVYLFFELNTQSHVRT